MEAMKELFGFLSENPGLLLCAFFYVSPCLVCFYTRKYHPFFVSFLPLINIYFAFASSSMQERENIKIGLKKIINEFELKGE